MELHTIVFKLACKYGSIPKVSVGKLTTYLKFGDSLVMYVPSSGIVKERVRDGGRVSWRVVPR